MVPTTVLAFTIFVGATLAAPPHVGMKASVSSTSSHPSITQMEWFAMGTAWTQVCGATIVTNMAVLSLARCAHIDFDQFYQPANRRIRAGADIKNTGGQLVNIHSVLYHPDFNTVTVDSDISIVRLSSPLLFSDNIRSTSIMPQDFNILSNNPVIYAGWGSEDADVLHEAGALTINDQDCVQNFDLPINKTQTTFCAEVPNINLDYCFSNIGGPVYYQNILAGIVYFGPCVCSGPDYPVVSTKVAFFSDWIVENA